MSDMTEEQAQLKVCEAASDYFYAKLSAEFAALNGGLPALEAALEAAVNNWSVLVTEREDSL